MSSSLGRSHPTPIDTKTLHRTSQLLIRHLDTIRGTRVLVVGYPNDNVCLLLQQHLSNSRVTLFNFDYAAHRIAREAYGVAGLDPGNLIFGAWYSPTSELHDVAVIFLPKSRLLIEMTLVMAASALIQGAQVFLVGENNAGIRASRTLLERYIGPVRDSDAARHSVLYSATLESDTPEGARLDRWIETFTAEVRDLELQVVSFPGVFSHGRLDAGTRFYLEHLEIPARARILDFGCGTGVIGATVKKLWPDSEVDMADSSALALEAASRTMEANGLVYNQIWPSDVFSDIHSTYTHILSNPPFHTGVDTNYQVVENFIKDAAKHLEKGGALRIVANRFLRYGPLIEKHMGLCRVIAENNLYRIYEGSRR